MKRKEAGSAVAIVQHISANMETLDDRTARDQTSLDRIDNSPAQKHYKVPDSIELIIKVSERCNLACTYCYFFFHEDKSYLKHPPTITETSVDGLYKFARSAAQSGVKNIAFVLHGGEPLLLKKKRIDSICTSLSAAVEGLCDYRFKLQTNGMLIDDGWIKLFSKWKIGVGVSLDGNEETNDKYRIDHKGRGSYQKTVDGIKKLHNAAADGHIRYPGVLSVVDPFGSGQSAYRHFVDDLRFLSLSFLIRDETHDTITQEIVDGTEKFMLEVFDEWTKDNRKDIDIRFFSDLIGCLCSDEMMEEFAPVREDVSRVYTVTSSGDLGLDDVIRSLGEPFTKDKFNVVSHSIEDIVNESPRREIREVIQEYQPPACVGCDWWKLCRGGRINTRYGKETNFEKETVYCSALKNIYGRIVSYLLDNGIASDDIARRLS
ncbi:MAG: hypothetical protein ACI9SP_000865 [Arenicella sp.]|jgi:uncharacterized protein